MRINEIFDEPIDDEKAHRAKQLRAAMDHMAKQYARPTPEQEAARRAKQEASRKAYDEHNERQKRVELALAPIAQKFKGDQLEDFKREAEALVPPDELSTVDLDTVFRLYNPDMIKQSEDSWNHYGEMRAKGDPSVVGPDGWTGD